MRPVGADEVTRDKAELRDRVRAARDAIPTEDRARMAAQVEERLLALPAVRDARTVLVFSSFGSEIPTDRVVDRLMREGKRVFLPFLEGGEMHAAELGSGDSLVKSSYGPLEPARREAIDPAEVDVVIAPGLAFDRHGFRVGYGGGHYDRYLARVRPGALRVGIAFHVQVVDRVPRGPDDVPLDVIVTDEETIHRPAGTPEGTDST